MSAFADLLTSKGFTDEDDIEWLHRLVEDWQMIADLAFADLVLWVKVDKEFTVVAHCRPNTGSTVYPHDEIGTMANDDEQALISEAMDTAKTCQSTAKDGLLQGAEAVPVVRAGHVIAVLTIHSDVERKANYSRMERNYRSAGVMLLSMIAEGYFPDMEAPSGVRRGEPRVGDGMLVLNREGRVRYASPNAISVLYRLGYKGEIEGRYLAELMSDLLSKLRPVDEILPLVLTGRAAWRTELESKKVSVALRSIPFRRGEYRTGALLLVRDISEIRRRERDLLSRDTMIREMHHRVKNNLQTVSALLRLQKRRVESPAAQSALDEAMRRVSVIAVVHDVLSQGVDPEVDFDEVISKGVRLGPSLANPNKHIELEQDGEIGTISSADATSLALAVTELVTNAIEHGFVAEADDEPVHGKVWIRSRRYEGRLEVVIADNGVGIGDNPVPGNGLGTQIVKTLVTTDLDGTIEWRPRDGGGTEVVLDFPLRSGT